MRRVVLRTLLGLASAGVLLLSPGSAGSELREIIAAQDTITTLEAAFAQTKVLSFFDETIESSGTIAIEKPDFYCWIYEEPERRVFYVDGLRTGSLEPSGHREEVALDTKIGLAAIIRSVTSIITGNLGDATEADYEVSRNESTAGIRSYTFYPRTEELRPLFKYVTIRFDERSKLARDLEIVEPNGDVTRMEFEDWRVNTPVDRSAYSR